MLHSAYKGLFDARDEAWRKVRSILTPTFSAFKLKEFFPLINDAVDVLLGKLETFAAKNGMFHGGIRLCCIQQERLS